MIYDKDEKKYYIRDLEVSITNLCNLSCDQCGFFVPNQRQPYIRDPVIEITECIKILKQLNIYIHKFPILGGEPTIDKGLLERAVKSFRTVNNFHILEIVTNGLIPQGVSSTTLRLINELTISKYFNSEELISLWKEWLHEKALNVKFSIRFHEWDQQYGDYKVSESEAQKMYENCWYRKHCTTIERKILFVCSRIAKCGDDMEGITLNEKTTLGEIQTYLNSKTYLPSCRKCTPLMGFDKVPPGIQKNNNINIQVRNAIKFLKIKLCKIEGDYN